MRNLELPMLSSRSFIPARPFLLVFLLGFAALSIACGGSGGGSSSDGSTTGSVAVVVTDAPTDEFVQVLVTFTRIDLLPGDDSDGSDRETIFEGRETIDLLSLENVSEPFAIADDVKAGTYSKLRMEVEEIELVRMIGSGFESEFARLPANGHIDLNSRGGFRVVPGETLVVQLDIDARNSLHINETGNGQYIFRPQVFVDIMSVDRPNRLISVEGIVRQVTSEEANANHDARLRIWLCEVFVNHRDRDGRSDQHCLVVYAGAATSVFDESGFAVEPDLIEPGDRIAVLGRFTTDEEKRFAIDAEVIELGGSNAFLVLTGVAESDYDPVEGSISFELDPGQGFAEGTEVEIVVVADTKFFSADGVEIVPEDVDMGSRLEVDGVLALSSSSPDLLRAAVIFVGENVEP
jgi:hypothetical protein